MKYKSFVVAIFIFTFVYSGNAQVNTFQKTYSGIGNLLGHSIKQTHDNGYVIAGMTFYNGTDNDDVFVIRLNEFGDTLWKKSYGGLQQDFGNSVSILQTDDDLDGVKNDGFFVTGTTRSFGNIDGDFYILKLDTLGNIQWESRVSGSAIVQAQAAWQCNDGSYVVAGSSNSSLAGSSDFYILKIDALGAFQWDFSIGGGLADHASSIQQTIDGGFIAVGGTRSFGTSSIDGGYVVKLSATGTLDWDQVYDHVEIDQFISLDQTSDGGYAMVGLIEQPNTLNIRNISLVKINASGNLLWAKEFGGNADERGIYLQETNDYGFIISGYTKSYGAGDRDLLLIKTDSQGDVDWAKTYGGANWESTGLWGESVTETSDGGFALFGNSDSYSGSSSLHALYMIKTDSNGISGCNETDITIDVNIPSFTVFTPFSFISGGLPYVSQVSSVANLPIDSVTTLCQFIPEPLEPEPEVCEPCGRKKHHHHSHHDHKHHEHHKHHSHKHHSHKHHSHKHGKHKHHKNDKVLICHVSNSKKKKKEVTICVSRKAADVHLAQGDYCGPCDAKKKKEENESNNHKNGKISESSINTAPTSIYPNPFTNTLTIKLGNYELENDDYITINIFDISGKVINNMIFSNSNNLTLDMSHVNSGIYIYQLRTLNSILETGKIIKE